MISRLGLLYRAAVVVSTAGGTFIGAVKGGYDAGKEALSMRRMGSYKTSDVACEVFKGMAGGGVVGLCAGFTCGVSSPVMIPSALVVGPALAASEVYQTYRLKDGPNK